MPSFSFLGKGWKDRLATLIGAATEDLLISSPFVTREGAEFVDDHLPTRMKRSGRLFFLTDLSPMPICQGATDPTALRSLADAAPRVTMFHLPKLHAKVYVADECQAIVTSGNLTAGGLSVNYEYGVHIEGSASVASIRGDIEEYAELGAEFGVQQLDAYCVIANRVRFAFRRELADVANTARREFEESFRAAEDGLVRLRLAGGAVHTVFMKTILYLLTRHGPMTTQALHPLIQSIHPDLCDDTIDRIIDGKRFGRKWKHAVRTAQQLLKRRRQIELEGELWRRTTTE